MDYEATLRTLQAWIGRDVAVLILAGEGGVLAVARIIGNLHSGTDQEETSTPRMAALGFDDESVFFRVEPRDSRQQDATGFHLLERAFDRAEWLAPDTLQVHSVGVQILVCCPSAGPDDAS